MVDLCGMHIVLLFGHEEKQDVLDTGVIPQNKWFACHIGFLVAPLQPETWFISTLPMKWNTDL